MARRMVQLLVGCAVAAGAVFLLQAAAHADTAAPADGTVAAPRAPARATIATRHDPDDHRVPASPTRKLADDVDTAAPTDRTVAARRAPGRTTVATRHDMEDGDPFATALRTPADAFAHPGFPAHVILVRPVTVIQYTGWSPAAQPGPVPTGSPGPGPLVAGVPLDTRGKLDGSPNPPAQAPVGASVAVAVQQLVNLNMPVTVGGTLATSVSSATQDATNLAMGSTLASATTRLPPAGAATVTPSGTQLADALAIQQLVNVDAPITVGGLGASSQSTANQLAANVAAATGIGRASLAASTAPNSGDATLSVAPRGAATGTATQHLVNVDAPVTMPLWRASTLTRFMRNVGNVGSIERAQDMSRSGAGYVRAPTSDGSPPVVQSMFGLPAQIIVDVYIPVTVVTNVVWGEPFAALTEAIGSSPAAAAMRMDRPTGIVA